MVKDMGEMQSNIIFGGHLGEYKYYDIDKVVESALERVKMEII